MTKENKKENSFMKNVLILMCSQIMVKILGLVYRLVITNIEGFGDTGLGYYASGYQIYTLLLAISSIGIPSVISKLVSEKLAVNDKKGAQRIFKISMAFFVGLGLILSFALFFGSEWIATVIFNVPDTKYVMQVLSPAITFVAASAVFRGYFAGQNDMKPTSASQVLEQLFNCILSITFVYALIGKEPYIMAAGGNLSTTCAIIISFMYLVMYYKKRKIDVSSAEEKINEENINKENIENKVNNVNKETKKEVSTWKLLKSILVLSVPVTMGSIISVVSPLIDTATVSRCIQTAFASMYPIKEELETYAMSMTGIMSKVDTIVGLPVAVNVAFATALIPMISTALAKKEMKVASKRMTFSMFASLLIILPASFGFIALAEPILKLIYPTATAGKGVLILCSISMIFIAMSHTTNGGLCGINKTYVPTIALVVAIIIKFTMNITLISNPNIGIYGAGMSSIVAQSTAFAICAIVLHKNLKLQFEFKRMILMPIISSGLMGVIAHYTHKLMNIFLGNTISTLVAILIGGITYIAFILLFKVLKKEDILMIPYGTKIYDWLVKIGIYKEEK